MTSYEKSLSFFVIESRGARKALFCGILNRIENAVRVFECDADDHGGDDVGLADCGDAMAAKLAEILRRESESVEGCAGIGIADINRVCGEDGVGAFDDDHGVM